MCVEAKNILFFLSLLHVSISHQTSFINDVSGVITKYIGLSCSGIYLLHAICTAPGYIMHCDAMLSCVGYIHDYMVVYIPLHSKGRSQLTVSLASYIWQSYILGSMVSVHPSYYKEITINKLEDLNINERYSH